MRGEKFEERRIAEVLLEVSIAREIFRVDGRNRQPVTTEVAGELKESDILFAHWIDDADGRTGGAHDPKDSAA